MSAAYDQHGHVADRKLAKLAQPTPPTRRQWVTPTWKRLETPMEVTMYVGRR